MKYVLGALALTGLFVACGPSDSLFSSGNPDEGEGGAGATGGDGGSSEGGTATGSPSGPSVGGAGAAGPGAGGMGGAITTAAGGSGQAMLDCGSGVECPVGENSACCWDQWMQYDPPQAVCVTGDVASDGCTTADPGEAAAAGYETRIECQRPDDCDGGQVCCGHRRFSVVLQTNFYEDVTCTNEAECNAQNERILLCDSLGVTAGCPIVPTKTGMVQTVCEASALLPPGYLVCGVP
jgi:hypothetical protein